MVKTPAACVFVCDAISVDVAFIVTVTPSEMIEILGVTGPVILLVAVKLVA
jgi:hypothetical protein